MQGRGGKDRRRVAACDGERGVLQQDHGDVAMGELRVIGTRFDHALLRVRVAELRVSANVTPAGEVRQISTSGDAGRGLPSTLMRIAR